MIEPSAELTNLQIHVDADACPGNVRRCLERITRQNQIPLIYYMDDSHELQPDYGQVRQVGQGRDAVDLALVNQTKPGDIVVTQDYGLAALVMARRASAIHPGGMLYTDRNIDQLLMERHLAAKARNAGEHLRGPRKRQKKDDVHFSDQLRLLIETALAQRTPKSVYGFKQPSGKT